MVDKTREETAMPLVEPDVAVEETLPPSKSEDTTPEVVEAEKPTEEATEVPTVDEPKEEVSGDVPAEEPSPEDVPVVETPLEIVEAPDPLDADFPVKYTVSKKIVDNQNPSSVVLFSVHLTGPDDADFGVRDYMQDLVGIADESIDNVGERIAQTAALSLYESKDFNRLTKIAPKVIKVEDTKVDVTPLVEQITAQQTEFTEKHKETQDAINVTNEMLTKQSEAITNLQDELKSTKDLLAALDTNYRAMSDWLAKFYTFITA